MEIKDIPILIARELSVQVKQVEATITLLDEGNTVPFIARYRKEVTGELDEEQIRTVVERVQYLRNFVKRQEEILASIDEQGKLTPELKQIIQKASKLQELEDLYLPYRPKKRTRAQMAREKGLDPLAKLIAAQERQEGNILEIAAQFQGENVDTAEEALAGALDILAETIAERADIRAVIRKQLWQQGEIKTQLTVTKEEGQAFLMYEDYQEPINRLVAHRILAVNRGEEKGALKVALVANHEQNIDTIYQKILLRPSLFTEIIRQAAADSYKRLLFPSLEREIRSLLTENAQNQAIKVFGLNLRQRLLEAPLSGYVVLGLDPGYRTGCKVAVVNQTGAVLTTSTIYLAASEEKKVQAKNLVLGLIEKYKISLVTIGNGTASYETEEFIAELIENHNLNLSYLIISEAGASVYSASKLAKEELPDLDVSLRGAVSIARRVQDPLAELVKIDPKSIGVGQYQHDVNQKELESALNNVVESCVNHVGVELNTASPALLTHVAGINSTVAKNIVAYRSEKGSFSSRKELLKVTRLGKNTFTQCAGFLRIQKSSNPLDNTSVHPESYQLAEEIIKFLGFELGTLQEKEKLIFLQEKIKKADIKELANSLKAGEPTVRDILQALNKPGRDPREDVPLPLTRKNIVKLSDLAAGSIVKGTVQNVTDFGAFVDIGIKINGLIHKSELSYKRFRHPLDIVSVGEIVECLILSVDEQRKRIALSLKQAKE